MDGLPVIPVPTFESLLTFAGLSGFLALIWLPGLKSVLPVITGRVTNFAGAASGIGFAVLAAVALHGFTWIGVGNAALLGFTCAMMATGLHQAKLAITNAMPKSLDKP